MSMPEIPDNQRWYIQKMFGFEFNELLLQEKRWWGWRTIAKRIICAYSKEETAREILRGHDSRWVAQQANARMARRRAERNQREPRGVVK